MVCKNKELELLREGFALRAKAINQQFLISEEDRKQLLENLFYERLDAEVDIDNGIYPEYWNKK